jgi:nucleoside-diphosphate-sugar epimerase
MQTIEQYADLLKTMDCAILIATCWGGPDEIYDVNVSKTHQLMTMLDPDLCQQVIYFSTASILDRQNQPLMKAGEIGTDYVKSKYQCYLGLSKLAIAPKITTVFPTLIFGGDSQKPYSHISAGIGDVTKWVGIARFFQAEGSFHFIHAKDVAQVVAYLVDHPPQPGSSRNLVLGNPAITVNEALEDACDYLHQPIYFRVPLTTRIANFFIALFNIQMAPWDRYCMEERNQTYQNAISPSTFALPTYCATVTDLLKLSGVKP